MKIKSSQKYFLFAILALIIFSQYFLKGYPTERQAYIKPIVGPIDKELIDTFGTATFFEYVSNNCVSNNLCVELTSDLPNISGAAWYNNSLSMSEGFSFSLCMNFGEDDSGGEGIALIARGYNTSPVLGGPGNNMGYSDIAPSFIIEFDTHYDPNPMLGDIIPDHITLIKNGVATDIIVDPIPAALDGSNIEDGELHNVKMTWDPDNFLLQIFFDGQLRISHQENLLETVFSNNDSIVIGATASTSNQSNLQYICLGSEPVDFDTQQEGCLSSEVPRVRLDRWYQTGHPDYGLWKSFNTNTKVEQKMKGDGPVFLVSPFEFMNVEIETTIKVVDSTYGGGFGFVFGYEAPFGSNYDEYNTWLFDWRKGTESLTCNPSISSQSGYRLSKIQGTIPAGCGSNEDLDYFWGDNNSGSFIISSPANGVPWIPGQEYDFKLIYRHSEAIILLKNAGVYDTLFYLDQCFEPARFGFYNISQPGVQYSFAYKHIVDFQLQAGEICEGDTAYFGFSDICNGNFDYLDSLLWDFGDGSNSLLSIHPDSQSISLSHLYEAPGTYTINLSIKNRLGCLGDTSKTIIVKPLPVPNFGADTTACNGEIITLDAGIENDSCIWNTGATTKTITVDTDSIYTVTLFKDGCSATHSIQVAFNNPLYNLPSEIDATCSANNGGAITFLVSGGTEPYSYFLDTVSYPGPTIDSLPVGNYSFLIIDSVGCELVIQETVQSLNNFDPNLLLINDISCFGETDGWVDFDSPEDLVYSLDGQNFEADPFFDELSEGDYIFYIKDTFNCISLFDFSIVEPGLLTLSLPEDITIELGDSILLESTTNGITLIYEWGPSTGMECMNCAHPLVYPVNSENYSLTIVNANGCTASDDVSVTVFKEYQVFVPNIFSPNKDGYNDQFMIYAGEGIKKIKSIASLQIIDRWGELVFERNNFLPDDYAVGWDGQLKGKPALQGVYVYMTQIDYIDGYTEFLVGNLTLIR